jgi:hypothetical protein
VTEVPGHEYRVACLGTGNHILSPNLDCQDYSTGKLLYNQHAIVIVRRAFVLHLLHQIGALKRGECATGHDALLRAHSGERYSLKRGVKLHLYINQTPCDRGELRGFKFRDFQFNSCCIKLLTWSVVGLQGAALSRYFKNPIKLNSIIISSQYPDDFSIQKIKNIYKVAVRSSRLANCLFTQRLKVPIVRRVTWGLNRYQSASSVNPHHHHLYSNNLRSYNWICDEPAYLEAINGQTGAQAETLNRISRLSKYAIFLKYVNCVNPRETDRIYRLVKREASRYYVKKNALIRLAAASNIYIHSAPICLDAFSLQA